MMSRLWRISTIVLLFHQYLYITSSSSSRITTHLFENWIKKHGKTYPSEQGKQYRIRILKENYDYITHHNSKANSSYTLTLNAFADLTHHEFKAKYLMGWPLPASNQDLEASPAALEDVDVAQPIRVGICASDRPFQFYSRGIFKGPCCDTVDHSVLIEENDHSGDGAELEYWNVKNSWGTNWGMNGYMHLARWDGNSCGISKQIIMMMNSLAKTTSSNIPPLPLSSPTGSTCYPIKCVGGATCCCHKRRAFLCVDFTCCPPANPVCCKINRTCCPKEYPNCVQGECFKKLGNITLTVPSKKPALQAMLSN